MLTETKTVKAAKILATFLILFLCVSTPLRAQAEQPAVRPPFYAGEAALKDYAEMALRENPSIRQALARYRADLQRVPQMKALPDPIFTFSQAIRNAETRVGPQLNATTLSQTFPWFGKLGLRGKVAVEQANAAYQLYEARQREVISQVKTAFYNLGYVDSALGITAEDQSILERYEQLAENHYAAGHGLQQEVIKMQAEITKVMDRLVILHQQRVSLVARLNTLMNRRPDASLPPVEPLTPPRVALDLDELYALGDQNRQELKAATARIAGNRRSIDLARKDFWPDFTVSAGLVNVGARNDLFGRLQPPEDNGKNALGVAVGINIPIWRGKYQAEVRQAAQELVAEQHSHANLRNEMEFAIRDQVIRLQTLRQQMDLFEEVLIPQAEEALRSTEDAYQTGQLGVLDLLDGERFLLEVRLINARYEADYLVALASLERAIGTEFPSNGAAK